MVTWSVSRSPLHCLCMVAAPCKHAADFRTECSSLLNNAKLSHDAVENIVGKHKNIDSTGVAMAKQAVTCLVPSQVVHLNH